MWPQLLAFFRGDLRARELAPAARAGMEAYDLVDRLPRGPARLAAWNAYVLQTYADKLISACRPAGYVRADTASVAQDIYELAGVWLGRARQLTADPDHPDRVKSELLPHWHTPIRSQDQLRGMRDTLEALRAFVAFDLGNLEADATLIDTLRGRLHELDATADAIEHLWIARPTAELRAGAGSLLTRGLDQAYALGQLLADPASTERG